MKNIWLIVTAVLVAMLVLAGIAFVAYVIFIVVAMSNFGSNK